MSRMWGSVLAVTGFLACPCHLPVTLPLVLGVLGGAGIGSFIGANTSLIYGLFTGYFVVGVAVGLYLLNRKRSETEGAACELPSNTRMLTKGRRKRTRAERCRARA